MSPEAKFMYLLENQDKVKGSDHDFLAQKDADHNLIPEEAERVERIYKELSELSDDVGEQVWGGLQNGEDEEIKVEEKLEIQKEKPKKKSFFKFW